MNWWFTTEAFVFAGIVLQAAAVLWVWWDWKLSQYQPADWRKSHRQSEAETLRIIAGLWSEFGGPASVKDIDWDKLSVAELEDLVKEFPARSDDDALTARKIAAITPRYGIGPSDATLKKIREQIEFLTLLRRGVPDYRTFMRKKTFRNALRCLLAGLALQAIGSWPSRWVHVYATETATTEKVK